MTKNRMMDKERRRGRGKTSEWRSKEEVDREERN